jgi:hypothetical protein
MLTRNKLYTLISLACIAGYVWLYFNLNSGPGVNDSTPVCLFKLVTNVPCPTCGATRSVLAITNGDFINAVLINPLGYLIACIMTILPIWTAFDFISKRNSLQLAYKKAEGYLRKPNVAVPLILLVILNWIWNISKGL